MNIYIMQSTVVGFVPNILYTLTLQQRDPDVGNLEGPPVTEHVRMEELLEEELLLLENASKMKDSNEGWVSGSHNLQHHHA